MRQIEMCYLSEKLDNKTAIDEVAEFIKLPDCSQSSKKSSKSDVSEVTLNATVMEELRSYVQTIASLYNENPFHSFDHANHVVMSVNKLLSRIIGPDLDDCTAQEIHDHTYGITSDPLTWYVTLRSHEHAFKQSSNHCFSIRFLGLHVCSLPLYMMWIIQGFPIHSLSRKELQWLFCTIPSLLLNRTLSTLPGTC
jgi:hypothetical protein